MQLKTLTFCIQRQKILFFFLFFLIPDLFMLIFHEISFIDTCPTMQVSRSKFYYK